MDGLYAGQPSITKTRVTEGMITKLKNAFPILERKKNSFFRRMQTQSPLVSSMSPVSQLQTYTRDPSRQYVNRQILNANREAAFMSTAALSPSSHTILKIPEIEIPKDQRDWIASPISEWSNSENGEKDLDDVDVDVKLSNIHI